MKKPSRICQRFGVILLGPLVVMLAVAAVLVSAASAPEPDRRGHVAGNDTVGIADARMVLQHIVGKLQLTPEQLLLADVNGDGEVTIADARLILQFIVDKIAGFPSLPDKTESSAGPTGPTDSAGSGSSTGAADSTDFTHSTNPTTDPTEPTESTGPRPPKENTIPIVEEQGGDDPKYEGRVYDGDEPWTDEEALNQGMFGRFLLRQEENPDLPFNVTCYVSKTRREISALLPAGTDLSGLVPVFTVRSGASVLLDGKTVTSGVTALDCRTTFKVAIWTGGELIEMTVRLWTSKGDPRLQGKAYIYEPGNDGEALNQGMFGKFLLRQEENPQLPYNVECYINKSGREISALLPAGIDITALVPVFTVPDGAAVTCGGKPVISGVTVLDFYDLFTLSVQKNGGAAVNMTVRVETLYTGLPSLSLVADDLQPINEKRPYRPVSFYVGGGDPELCPYAQPEPLYMRAEAKNRGASSRQQPKRQHNIKLANKASVLGMPKAKDWSMISNVYDKSLIRNALGQHLAGLAGIEFVMKQVQVDFWLNGKYMGTYTLSEKKEVDENRISLPEYYPGAAPGEIGYIVEVDHHSGDGQDGKWDTLYRPIGPGEFYRPYYNPVTEKIFFKPRQGQIMSIKYPQYDRLVEAKDMQPIQYICDRIEEALDALRERDWTRIDRFMDVRSFVKWYMVNEYMNNGDSGFNNSCFIYLKPGGKLCMGPVWDFDGSSGNNDNHNVEGRPDFLYNHGAAWFYMLFEHPRAREILKEEWAAFYPKIVNLTDWVDQQATMISRSARYNFQIWDVLNRPMGANLPEIIAANTHEKQITLLKNWLNTRRERMDPHIRALVV
ncbi:MAG: CotH kinase family protein [Oscillospiraceae bacterium]|nr:CotH kinase family protein [Oscillospiraceae bacterium]